jgi:hypothetical protein
LIWERRFADSLTPGNARAAIDWLVAAFAFLSDAFAPEMNFPDDDWEDIRELLSAEAEDLDMDTLTSMMTVIVRAREGVIFFSSFPLTTRRPETIFSVDEHGVGPESGPTMGRDVWTIRLRPHAGEKPGD